MTANISTIQLSGAVRLDRTKFDALPPLPDGVPAPQVSIEMTDEARTVVSLGRVSVRFWATPGGEFDSYYQGEDAGAWDALLTEEQVEAMREWGAAVHKRMEAFMYQALMAAMSEDVEAEMVKFAVED
jgi:hypothetical protein